MKNKWLLVLLTAALAAFVLQGCNWVGRTAGKTQAKIEKKVDSLEEGYNEGYEKEKKK